MPSGVSHAGGPALPVASGAGRPAAARRRRHRQVDRVGEVGDRLVVRHLQGRSRTRREHGERRRSPLKSVARRRAVGTPARPGRARTLPARPPPRSAAATAVRRARRRARRSSRARRPVAPLARNAATTSSRRRPAPASTVDAARARTGCGRSRPGRRARRSGPRVARNARGRAPVAASDRVGRGRRRASNAAAGRYTGRPPPGRPAGGGAAVRGDRLLVAGRGNSLTPVIGVARGVATSVSPGRAHGGGQPLRDQPGVERGDRAARRSISWKNAQAARASSSVSDSTYQEPPAGSITRARCDSSTRSDWVLRAIRRENGVGSAERGVERQHGDRVGAADAGGEAGDGGRAACSPTGRGGSSSPAR